nr:site-specific integrase [uncultured Pseudogulbenkiania sp.]
MAALKNVIREKTTRRGCQSWLLRDCAGEPIQAFDYFCEKNLGYRFTTQKRYAEAVSQFIDYLIEAQAFGTPVTKTHLNDVIEAYPIFLRDGSAALSARLQKSINQHPEDLWLLKVAQSLNRPPLKPKSFDNTIPAINRFLKLSEALAQEAFEKATLAGVKHNDSYKDLIEALAGNRLLTAAEIRNMRQNSVLGSVIRFKGEGMTRPRRLTAASAGTIQDDIHHFDFPFEYVIPLAGAATLKRDKALWLLLAASGMRTSEAVNLQWSDIDLKTREVFVYDPSCRRFGTDMTPQERIRFKGRTVSMTYLIQPFRQAFFQALEEYVREEYVPPRDQVAASFVFQYVESSRRGIPLLGVSATSLNDNFKAACARAGVPSPFPADETAEWSLHSLRHLYGVYMVNDFPVDPANSIYGLELAEVQLLMGHADINSTRHYARKKRRTLEHKLKKADQYLIGLPIDASPLFSQNNEEGTP